MTIRSGVITSRIETALAVAEDLVHRDQVLDEALDLAEHPLVGQRDVEERARERPRGGQQRALAPEHLVEPPARDVGEREQPQRLAGRRAVDDHDVPAAVLDVALELEQAEQLVAAGRDGQLLGRDAVDALVDEQPAEPALDRGPVALELVLRLHLLGPQAAADLGRLGADRRPPASPPASAPGRWTARSCAAPRRRSGARSPRRRRSSRPRPCPYRGSCAASTAALALLRLQDVDRTFGRADVTRQVDRGRP